MDFSSQVLSFPPNPQGERSRRIRRREPGHGETNTWRSLPISRWILGAVLVMAGAGLARGDEDPATGVFAKVDDHVITAEEFQAAVNARARQKFYHGQPPEPELRKHRIEVGEFLIGRVLLVREAERRGLQAQESSVAAQLDRLEQRFAGMPDWPHRREQFRKEVGQRLRMESRIAALEAQVRNLALPSDEALQEYYAKNPGKFTTPERTKVSVILRRVPASGSTEQWESARSEIEHIAGLVRQGSGFSDLARRHSQDASAEQGGDMGYLHEEMLGASAQEALSSLKPGEMTGPVRLLEGSALLRLDARVPAQLNPLASVQQRAAALWRREAEEGAWQQLEKTLRVSARIRVDESYYDRASEGAKPVQLAKQKESAAAKRTE